MGVYKVYLRSIWAYLSRAQRKSFLQLAIRHFNYPKNVLMSRLISQFFCNLNSSNRIHITEFTSPIAKSTSPGYRNLLSLHADKVY